MINLVSFKGYVDSMGDKKVGAPEVSVYLFDFIDNISKNYLNVMTAGGNVVMPVACL